MPKTKILWPLLLVVTPSIVIVISILCNNLRPEPTPRSVESQFKNVESAWKYIQDNYYGDVKQVDLQQGAIKGMVNTLDKFSTWYPAGQDRKTLYRELSGKRCDLGLQFLPASNDPHKKGVIYIGPMANSPAHAHNIFRDCSIISINNIMINNLTIAECENLINCNEGDKVRCKIARPRATKTETIVLECKEYEVSSIKGLWRKPDNTWEFMLPKNPALRLYNKTNGAIGYLRISNFSKQAQHELTTALASFTNGLIIDLRDSPGGYLDAGIAMVDMFLDKGTIVEIKKVDAKVKMHQAHQDNKITSLRVVVLINENTSSAAELMAGALAENDRAILIGTRTMGKGCIQKTIDLDGDLGRLNLTVGEFLVNPDLPIHKRKGATQWGVDPYIPCIATPAEKTRLRQIQRKNDVPPPPKITKTETRPAKTMAPRKVAKTVEINTAFNRLVEVLKADTALNTAVNLLSHKELYSRHMKSMISEKRNQLKKRTSKTKPALKK